MHIMGKMAGAVGNYNAHISAYPEVHSCHRLERCILLRPLGCSNWVLSCVHAGVLRCALFLTQRRQA